MTQNILDADVVVVVAVVGDVVGVDVFGVVDGVAGVVVMVLLLSLSNLFQEIYTKQGLKV